MAMVMTVLCGGLFGLAVMSAHAQELVDFGDAPAPYPTIQNANGAAHIIRQGLRMGELIDSERDGQPNASATGDDNDSATAPSDEDGVEFLDPVVPGGTARVRVVVSEDGFLNAWMDFEIDGSWAEDIDWIFRDVVMRPGENILEFTVPRVARPGVSFARFRYNLDGKITFTGLAQDGEVEDYAVPIGGLGDFGDAPQVYPVLLSNNGARHAIDQKFYMGSLVDPEADGQSSSDATGDDKNPVGAADDEDGVIFITVPLPAGGVGQVEIQVSQDGRIDAWVDFNQDGDWADENEKILDSLPAVPGINLYEFDIPPEAKAGATFARFRLSREGQLSFDGPAPDGEVEDYQIDISSTLLDYGDAPDTPNGGYRTLLLNNGARHVISQGFYLGKRVDADPDGRPTNAADGDDLNPPGLPDDEDGVTFMGALAAGGTAQIVVEASQAGRLDAWVDFNLNVSWLDAGEKIFDSVPLVAGLNTLTFPVPFSLPSAQATYARFRFSREGGLRPEGPAPDGEVEDYRVPIQPLLDFSDAPDPTYPTLLASDGARHVRNPDVFLGFIIDVEADGQPNNFATGDDLAGIGTGTSVLDRPDDEDGVVFTSIIRAGDVATVEVRASTTGMLNTWIDFNANGSWADPGEHVFDDRPISGGVNTLTFDVPADAASGLTFSRFRFNLQGGLSFTGLATDGEVEDHALFIRERLVPCEQSNKGSDFWLTFPGNYAPDPDNPIKLSLCIVGPRTTTGRVEIPGLGYATNFTIGGSMKADIFLPKEADLGDDIDVISDKGIHVTADADVAVWGMNRVLYTTDGFLGIPSALLGRRYIIQSYSNVHSGVLSLNGTQFGLVACETNTTVTIVPSTSVAGRPAGVPYDIVLNSGQTYQLRDTNDAPVDLSGTLISADKPLAAFGSHQCANIQSPSTWFCDYIVEQLLPVERAGRTFVAGGLATRAGDTYRVFATEDKTAVSFNGGPATVIDRGQHVERVVADGAMITANKPVLAVQYSNSSDHDGVTDSDPFELIVPSVDMWMNDYMVCVPDAGYDAYYLNVVIASGGAGAVQLDGVNIPAAQYDPIHATGFSVAQVSVTPGVHNLRTIAGTAAPPPFGVSVYGWSEYDSFGFPGGMFFRDVIPPTVTCLVTNGYVPAQDNCGVVLPDLRSLVLVEDNCGVCRDCITQTPPPQTFLPVGTHVVTITAFDVNQNAASCQITVNVVDISPISIDCPSRRVVNCETKEGAKVEFDVPAFTSCGYPADVVCDPPSGSLFPPGTTTVTCTATTPVGQTSTCTFDVIVRCLSVGLDLTQPGTLTITWTGNGILQQADKPEGPYQDAPNQTSPFTLTPTQGSRFYRVAYPDN